MSHEEAVIESEERRGASAPPPPRRRAWMPIPLLLAAIAVLWIADLRGSHESLYLIVGVNFVFTMLVSLSIAYLAARSFVAGGQLALLMLGCGVLVWGTATMVASAGVERGANFTVTVHNLGVWLSVLCHLTGAVLARRSSRVLRAPGWWLALGYGGALGAAALVTLPAAAGWTPTFFVEGQGGTPLRQLMMASAIAMFSVTALLMRAADRRAPSPFLYWYRLGLALLAAGLLGVMLDPVQGGALSWTGRAAQLLGGVYMLVAAIASVRETGGWGISLRPAGWDWRVTLWDERIVRFLMPAYFWSLPRARRFGLAVLASLAATALRWSLIPWLGTISPYNVALLTAVVATVLLGIGPGMLSVLLSAVGVEVFITGALWPAPDGAALARLATSMAIGVFICCVLHAARIAQVKARKSEARLAAFAEASFEGIAESEAGRIVDMNGQFARMMGCSVAEAKGVEIASLIAPEDRERVMKNIREGHESVIEHVMLRRDGTRLIVEAHGRPVSSGAGRRYTVIRDVTARKRAEAEQHRLAEQRQIALDAAHMGWWHYDPVTRIASWDERYKEIFGVTGNQRPNDEILKRLHPDDLPGVWASVEAALNPADPQPYSAEYRIRLPDGTERWIEAHGIASFEGAGDARRATSFVGTVADITARKHAEEQIRAREEKIEAQNEKLQSQSLELQARNEELARQVAERKRAEEELNRTAERLVLAQRAASAGAWDWDIPGGRLTWSEEFFELFGMERCTEPSFDLWRSVLHPDDREAAEARIHRSIQGRTPLDSEYRIIRPDGQVRWIGALGRTTYDEAGRPLRMTGICIDMTERKRGEADLISARASAEQARAAAEAANRAKDHFLSVLSHELRTPLTPVLMISSAWESDETVPAWMREDMGMVRRCIELETKLIDDLLDINRIMRGKLALRVEDIDAHLKLIGAVEICRPEAESKSIALTTELTAGVSHLLADPGRLQQVVWNLVKNSIKFTPGGGWISVRTWNPAAGLLRIEVKDTGIGIPPETLPRLFNPFEQAHGQISRQFGGLGLGLAICKALVEAHGGTIAGTSDGAGTGTTFTVDFPTIPPRPVPDGQAVESDAPRAKPLRIMLVEDHQITAEMMMKMLSKAGHEVRTAGSVRQALEAAEGFEFDVLLSDLGLPDGAGHDVLRALRTKNPRMKAIALSGYGMEQDIERSRGAGFLEHLTKPVDFRTLQAALARITGPQ